MRESWTLIEMGHARALLLAAYYHLMDDPRYWYRPGLKDASALLCSRASDFLAQILRETTFAPAESKENFVCEGCGETVDTIFESGDMVCLCRPCYDLPNDPEEVVLVGEAENECTKGDTPDAH